MPAAWFFLVRRQSHVNRSLILFGQWPLLFLAECRLRTVVLWKLVSVTAIMLESRINKMRVAYNSG
jgi:hypothetical protein